MISVRNKLVGKIKDRLQGTPYSDYSKEDIRIAVHILEGKILETMQEGKALGIKNSMMIYPDPGSMAVRKAKRRMALKKYRRRFLESESFKEEE